MLLPRGIERYSVRPWRVSNTRAHLVQVSDQRGA